MSRPRSTQPAYQYHISGQARVILGGQDYYLGKHGSEESHARYHALLAEYNRNGKQAPQQPKQLADTTIRVRDVVADYRNRVLPRYAHNSGQHSRISTVLSTLETRHGDDAADSFGPRKLDSVRDHLKKTGNSRRYINDQIKDVVRVFRYGIARELVPPAVVTALECLEPLKKGEAKESKKRKPADIELVKRTMPHLSKTLSAMVRIQVATAMRPSEIFRMRPADIDRSGEIWFYRPEKHKTADAGKVKAVPILGDARAALTPFLFGDSDDVCFRTTRGNTWNKDNYRQAIRNVCDRERLPRWTPYQIRHMTAQAVRDALGVEDAQALLGHSRVDTTELYSKASEAKAIRAAQAAPSVG